MAQRMYSFNQKAYPETGKGSCAALSTAWLFAMRQFPNEDPKRRMEELVEFAKTDAPKLQRRYENACNGTPDKSGHSLGRAYRELIPLPYQPCDPKVGEALGRVEMDLFGGYAERNGELGILFTFHYSFFGCVQDHTIGLWGRSNSAFLFDADLGEFKDAQVKGLLVTHLNKTYGGRSKNRGFHYLHVRGQKPSKTG